MKMIGRAFLSLTILATVSGITQAGYIRGIELQNWCASKDLTDKSSCVAYILGVHDTIERVSASNSRKLYCLPEGTGSEKLFEAVVNYLSDNPKTIHLSASSNVLLALKKQYTCKQDG